MNKKPDENTILSSVNEIIEEKDYIPPFSKFLSQRNPVLNKKIDALSSEPEKNSENLISEKIIIENEIEKDFTSPFSESAFLAESILDENTTTITEEKNIVNTNNIKNTTVEKISGKKKNFTNALKKSDWTQTLFQAVLIGMVVILSTLCFFAITGKPHHGNHTRGRDTWYNYPDFRIRHEVPAVLSEKETNFFRDIRKDNLTDVTLFLDSEKANLNIVEPSTGQNALHVAVESHDPKMVELIIERAPSMKFINAYDNAGRTPLGLALEESCYLETELYYSSNSCLKIIRILHASGGRE